MAVDSTSDFYFFFSYARRDQELGRRGWSGDGDESSDVDAFFEDLRREVARLTGHDLRSVGFRDSRNLSAADHWPEETVSALQRSRTMVALLSPTYFGRDSCGREFEIFRQRCERCRNEHGKAIANRIVPVLWVKPDRCWSSIPSAMSPLFRDLNYSFPGMPSSYPASGLHRSYALKERSRVRICQALADRVVELAEAGPLPSLPDINDFNRVPSAFHVPPSEAVASQTSPASGASAADIVYVVPQRAEVERAGWMDVADRYDDRRGGWRPFPEAPGATVEAATEEGMRAANVPRWVHRDFPDDLGKTLRSAEGRESPVLLVLDRRALRLGKYRAAAIALDRVAHRNAGLVTAGSGDVSDEEVAGAFPNRHGGRVPHHVWTVPPDRMRYVSTVATTIDGLRRDLLISQVSSRPPEPARMPALAGPGRLFSGP